MNTELYALVPLGRRGLIQATNIILILLVATLATLRTIYLNLDYLPIPAIFVVAVGLANAIYLWLNGSVDVAAKILMVSALLGLAFSSFYTGGVGSSVVLLAPLIPIMTVLLINTLAGWVSLALVSLILAAVFVLGLYDHVPENPIPKDLALLGRYIVLTCLCLITTWVVSSFYSISQKLLMKLEKQSQIDYLTGILNRRGIQTRLIQEIDRARRSGTWLSFIMADVDFFKLYNDSNGHQAGDNCLKDIATLINDSCERATDTVGRFGGEEFILILPDTNSDGARRLAEKLRKKVMAQNIPYGPHNTNPVTLTLGVVSAHGHTIQGIEKLITEADKALYKGKDQGRNCVVSTVLEACELNE